MNELQLSLLCALRHTLHRQAERSGEEFETCKTLRAFLREHTSLEICGEGNHFYAAYRSGSDKPGIAFRGDVDAVPMAETLALPYGSENPGTSHKCGHDGHAASLCGVALMLEELKPDRDVFLFFQPAEETGAGALECLEWLERENVGEIFAYHNLPGYPMGHVIASDDVFACASHGLILNFVGRNSHAAFPENGRNPGFSIAALVSELHELTHPTGVSQQGLVLSTLIHVGVGAPTFGTSPSNGTLMLTLRAEQEKELEALQARIRMRAEQLAAEQGLTVSFEICDAFPETRNYNESVSKLRMVCRARGIAVEEVDLPLRASEDFGHFLKYVPGAIYGLGTGVDCPPLHTAEYDFPDELLSTAVDLFTALI